MVEQQAQQTKKRKAKFAWKAHTIFDDLGRRLDERTIVFGTPPKDFSLFIGFGHATTEHPRVAEPIHGEFRFPIFAEDYNEALDKYDEAMAEYLPKARKELYNRVDEQIKQMVQAQNAVLPASMVPPTPPMGPGGNPFGGPGGNNGRIVMP